MKKLLIIITILLTTTLASCNKNSKNIKVIATSIPHAEILEVAKPLLEEKGYKLEIIVTSDYYLPNPAVASGDADANFFQHIPFLNNYNSENEKNKLVIAAHIHIEPIGIYSKKYSKLSDIENGSTVLISNSTSDHGRVLNLFKDAGLITLSESFNINSNDIDFNTIITSNPKGLVFKKDAAPDFLVASYKNNEADLYVINSNYALEGNLNPVRDSLFIEKTLNNPYVNIVATTPKLLNSDKIKALVEALSNLKVKDFIDKEYGGSVINY